ncbi:family 43 glycosylhydrolase [Agromyces atrinae]|uniref:family 43 glycosylhydrolase n=1 Tax=Agromyces atrinae TaxID=592376 RepID=UPI001F5A0D6B|nr:family 43 glycosylhydrolase [Agromyces atrinae]MCI2957213.1 family 43 glycosylhydrolase [Agromyces atrinae]
MTGVIRPGEVIVDEAGAIAQLHGIGVQRVGDRFYAWGENKAAGSTFTAVSCYSSADLATWRFEGEALTVGEGDLAADRIVERPKVLAHPDGRFVMFLHIDSADYADARVGFAVADAPAGPYRYLGSERPLGNLSRDIGVYQEDGVGYLLSEDRVNGLHLYRLAPDYLSVESVVATTLKDDGSHGYESPTLIREGGLYYLFGSDLTGWAMNDNEVSTAADLTGPWSPWADIAPAGSATFESQVSIVVPVDGSHVYIGDRWTPDDLRTSPAVWLPIEIGAGAATLRWRDEWTIADLRGAAAPGDDA